MKFSKIEKDAGCSYDGKIIIIGAGVSGLFAANALKYTGCDNFIVLEASDRIGGRLKSVDNFHDDVPLDVGAEWIHASNEQIVKDMLVFQDDDVEKDLAPSEFVKYQPQFYFRNKRSRLVEMIYQETKWKRSTWWDYLDKFVYQHVLDKVQLNSPVIEIQYDQEDQDQNRGQAKVILADGSELLADKIICTVSLAVLKKQIIEFRPPLPQKKLDAIEATDMPPGFRILFEMKENFYPDATLTDGIFKLLQIAIGDITLIYDPLYGKDLSSSQNILAYVAVGHKNAGEMSKLEDGDLVNAALAKIDELFDGQGSKNYVKHIVQNWSSDPYILGTYTFPGVSRHHRSELGKTVRGKIIFAGEHTSINHYSLVSGAANEGRRAAMEAIGQKKSEHRSCMDIQGCKSFF